MNKRNVLFFAIVCLLISLLFFLGILYTPRFSLFLSNLIMGSYTRVDLPIAIGVWLYPSLLYGIGLGSCLWTFKSRFRGLHQLNEWKKLRDTDYWPKEKTNKVHRSLVVRIMHSISILIRCISPLQYFKPLYKVRPMFRVDQGFQGVLNKQNVSEYLRSKFKDNGVSLSGNASVLIEVKANEWQIDDKDQNQRYVIKSEGRELNVSPSGGSKVKTLDDPAMIVEIYGLLWMAYVGFLGIFLHYFRNSEYFPSLLLIVLIHHAIDLVHSNLYYNLLRMIYYAKHSVHYVSRSVALLIASYLELCLLFAVIYLGLGHQFTDRITTFWDALYLSVITITTLGYGDITPNCCTARILLSFQALAGLAMLGIAITRVLGLMGRPIESLREDGK